MTLCFCEVFEGVEFTVEQKRCFCEVKRNVC